ncbi:MAG: NAD(P)H-dependent oxidoreductase [Sulfitobacter sp.]|nr:NAD(P)H-dependent oxidoreductase [Sulfitobacter sp.]
MKTVLIIQGNPDPAGNHLCHAIAAAYREAAETAGHQVMGIDVAQEQIPFLRTKEEWEGINLPPVAAAGQKAVTKADHIVLIYPLWMGDMPAILKAWIEQVFRKGFAFEMDGSSWQSALKGKSARVMVTMGMPGFAYRWFYLAHSLRSLKRNILKICGIGPVKSCVFGNAEDPSGRAQQGFIATARRLGASAG